MNELAEVELHLFVGDLTGNQLRILLDRLRCRVVVRELRDERAGRLHLGVLRVAGRQVLLH